MKMVFANLIALLILVIMAFTAARLVVYLQGIVDSSAGVNSESHIIAGRSAFFPTRV